MSVMCVCMLGQVCVGEQLSHGRNLIHIEENCGVRVGRGWQERAACLVKQK